MKTLTKIYLNTLLILLVVFLVYGLFAPMMVSAASTMLVALGFFLAAAVGPGVLFALVHREVDLIQRLLSEARAEKLANQKETTNHNEE